jgi:hypothetical protein
MHQAEDQIIAIPAPISAWYYLGKITTKRARLSVGPKVAYLQKLEAASA